MSAFSLGKLTSTQREGTVRIGSITVFALVIIVCMAVLAVLATSTAHSSLVLSQRQAAATKELYLDETAAQVFLANLDDTLAAADGDPAATATDRLPLLLDRTREAMGGRVATEARAEDGTIFAEFTCAGGRTLKIAVTMLPDGSYRIDRWRMTAVENEEQPLGTLYTGA